MLFRYIFLYCICAVYRALGKTSYYENKFGVKVLNRKNCKTFSEDYTTNAEVLKINADDLLLGIDGLKNPYTHCGKPVLYSPHYAFMRDCDKSAISSCTDYVQMERKGCLDGRDSFFRPVMYHKRIFENRKKFILSRKDVNILVYRVKGKYYISDGKHRAALGVYLGLTELTCEVRRLSNATLEYMEKMYLKMLEKPADYSINLALIKNIFEEYKEDLG